jgi:D-alanyl-lipoteichoic acid acyltransferase DltB (MBOAT superfamily)
MLFDTPAYLLFLTLVVLIYWRLNHKRQNLFLLAISYFFYGWWDWRFLLLMMGSTVVDYVIARRIGASNNRIHRRALLTFSLLLNFGFLGFFKYFNFFIGTMAHSMELIGAGPLAIHTLSILLPPGISFYTFQEVAYIVDVYSGKLEAAESLTEYALFISLFPHLIAGPIQRPGHLLPQVQGRRHYDPEKFFDGCMLIVSGLFRKCVIADHCALIANAGFEGRLGHNFFGTVLGVLAFALQIYGDFSAYSDFARGSAQLLGFHFMVNFRQPYLATSLQDFWRRWHISLSTWLRDYLYIPLGGSRNGRFRTYRNLMSTMLLGGLWHGANWTFVIWGGIHGAGLSAERLVSGEGERSRLRSDRQNALVVFGKRLLTFSMVCLAWVFFRADSVSSALRMLADIRIWEWQASYATAALLLGVVYTISFLIDMRLESHDEEYLFQKAGPLQTVPAALAMVVVVAAFAASQSNAFIYFQF